MTAAMLRMTAWLRNLGGLWAACVLALLVAAPTTSLAACLCADDTVVQASAVQAIQSDRHEESTPCKAACCVGGHCHHAGSALAAPAATVDAPTPEMAEHAVTASRVLASRPPSALDRPPRA